MKKYLVAAWAVTILASGAEAASFNFSFVNSGYSSTSVVAGVLGGLVEGTNDVTGLTATVTSGLGIVPDNFTFSLGKGAGGSFTVTGGQITYANAYFLDPDTSSYLFLGTDPFRTTFYPELFNARSGADAVSLTAPLFSPVAAAAVPEPAAWALMIAGFGMIGAGVRRSRHRTTVCYA